MSVARQQLIRPQYVVVVVGRRACVDNDNQTTGRVHDVWTLCAADRQPHDTLQLMKHADDDLFHSSAHSVCLCKLSVKSTNVSDLKDEIHLQLSSFCCCCFFVTEKFANLLSFAIVSHHRAWLVLGWVTVCRRVNHLDMLPTNSAWPSLRG